MRAPERRVWKRMSSLERVTGEENPELRAHMGGPMRHISRSSDLSAGLIHRADIRRCIREGPTLLAVQRDLLVQTSSAACCAARPRPAITDRRRGWRRANPTAARFLANYPSDSACAR